MPTSSTASDTAGWRETRASPLPPPRSTIVDIAGCVALVTGAEASLGPSFVAALLARGAKKVYVAATDTVLLRALLKGGDRRLAPLPLDVTDPYQVGAAATVSSDVSLLINNVHEVSALRRSGAPDIDAARREMEVNYLGLLDMTTQFAPVLVGNKGVMVNILMADHGKSHAAYPSYAASQMAAKALTRSLRDRFAAQGTRVIGVLALPPPSLLRMPLWPASPERIASDTLDAVASGANADLASWADAPWPGRKAG
jgi:NAD(P)-dependent dehydrogenase (short-subunit alcohol dehydrogenase family)